MNRRRFVTLPWKLGEAFISKHVSGAQVDKIAPGDPIDVKIVQESRGPRVTSAHAVTSADASTDDDSSQTPTDPVEIKAATLSEAAVARLREKWGASVRPDR